MTVGLKAHKLRYCAECRIARMLENLVSLMSRTGEQYEALIKAQHEAKSEAARGRGSSSESS